MAELQKGHTYNSGDIVDAADLNAHVDAATALKGIVMDQPIATPDAANDYVLFNDVSALAGAGDLARCKVSALPNGVTSVAWDTGYPQPTSVFTASVVTGTTTAKLRLSISNQGANKVLAAPATASGAPSFRVLVPTDFTPVTVLPALFDIDWSLGNVFAKIMPDNATRHFSFSNVRDGQTIRVRVQQWSSGGTAVAHWDDVTYWRGGGAEPTLSTGASVKDIFTFTAVGSSVYGQADQNFAP